MKLIIGLGNIGANYDGTRHNAGFMALNTIAKTHGLQWQQKDRFKATVAQGVIGGQKVTLAKPDTFYNLSGQTALAIKQFYKIANSDILVIHDELALPFGTLRSRVGGSDAGNNGIKSISEAVGTDTARIRIGIANQHLSRTDAADFVLGHFSADEKQTLPDILKKATAIAEAFIQNSFEHTTV